MTCITAAIIVWDWGSYSDRYIRGGYSLIGCSVAFVLFDMYAAWAITKYISELRRIGVVLLNTELHVKQAPK